MSTHSEIHDSSYYIKVWATLLLLLIISVCGPMLEIRWLTLITAFGIAVVKAYLVASHFMHLSIEKKYITYLLLTMLLLMALFYGGTAPDVRNGQGHNWEIEYQFELDEASRLEWCHKWECPVELDYCNGKCDSVKDH